IALITPVRRRHARDDVRRSPGTVRGCTDRAAATTAAAGGRNPCRIQAAYASAAGRSTPCRRFTAYRAGSTAPAEKRTSLADDGATPHRARVAASARTRRADGPARDATAPAHCRAGAGGRPAARTPDGGAVSPSPRGWPGDVGVGHACTRGTCR